MDANQIKTVGIIGGGKAGQALFLLFSKSSAARVSYVADTQAAAPACVLARQAGIKVYTDLEAAMNTRVDYIIEVTGDPDVEARIRQKSEMGVCGKVFSHDMAKLMMQVFEDSNSAGREDVKKLLLTVQGQVKDSFSGINSLVDGIEDITSQMTILAINARIEAARVGEQGKGFAVVAQQMSASANSVQDITREIGKVNESIQAASTQIEVVMKKIS